LQFITAGQHACGFWFEFRRAQLPEYYHKSLGGFDSGQVKCKATCFDVSELHMSRKPATATPVWGIQPCKAGCV
jgi:hypothetical protein